MTAPLVRVGDVAQQVRGVSYGKHEASTIPQPGYLPLLRAGNITDHGLVFDDLVFVPAERIGAAQRVRRNDVLIAASSGSLDVVGKAARAPADYEGGFGAFCKVLRPCSTVDPVYFAHFFRTQDYRRHVSALAAGININNLRNEHLNELQLPLPPLAEQRRIAAVLEKADTLQAKRRAALAKLDTLVQAIFLEMFGDPASNPRAWPVKALGDLISTGPQNGLYKPAADYGSGTPILRIDAFYNGKITDPSKLRRVRISADEQVLYGLRLGEIVINRVNSREYLGKSAIVPPLSEPTVFESNMMRFDVDREVMHPAFLIEYLQGDFIRTQILRRAKDAVNQSSINQQDVKGFPVYVPPMTHQQSFVRMVLVHDRLRSSNTLALTELDALFASLQHRAFRGEL